MPKHMPCRWNDQVSREKWKFELLLILNLGFCVLLGIKKMCLACLTPAVRNTGGWRGMWRSHNWRQGPVLAAWIS